MKKSNKFARLFVLLCALMLQGLCACAGPGHVLPERTTEPVPKPAREEIPELAGAVDNAGGVTRLYLFYSITDKENLPRYIKANYLVIDAVELLKQEG